MSRRRHLARATQVRPGSAHLIFGIEARRLVPHPSVASVAELKQLLLLLSAAHATVGRARPLAVGRRLQWRVQAVQMVRAAEAPRMTRMWQPYRSRGFKLSHVCLMRAKSGGSGGRNALPAGEPARAHRSHLSHSIKSPPPPHWKQNSSFVSSGSSAGGGGSAADLALLAPPLPESHTEPATPGENHLKSPKCERAQVRAHG